jgi:uncharacterized 2Fe-2S/4Fe-4S cluster protein (DUF4445 family)
LISKLLSNNTARYKIRLQPIGRIIEVDGANNLLEAIRLSGTEIIALCGGIGACDSCKIRVISGDVSEPTLNERETFTEEELNVGFRLACQLNALSDLSIEIPSESFSTPQRLQIEGQQINIDPSPIVKIINLEVPPPSLNDLRSDASRIIDALQIATSESAPEIDYGILKNLSPVLRDNHWSVSTVLHEKHVIAVFPRNTPLYGIAVDIGTTKIAAYLVEFGSGEIVEKGGRMNPQISFGEDVISRISYANTEEQGGQLLQHRLISEINALIANLVQAAANSGLKIKKEQIIDAVFVGNTAMHHLFAGLPVKQLGEAPYVAAISHSMLIPAHELGLHIAEGARVYLPPVIAGYIGPDHIAMLTAIDISNLDETCLALDIGTNTEITLMHNGHLFSCSCASGPAFEGAHIEAGMRAAQGAIERIKIDGERTYCSTIGSVPPIGICGSGVLDAVSELLAAGLLDRRGGLRNDDKRIVLKDNELGFIVVPEEISGSGQPIVITRKDINEIQLAKGAIRTGIEILLQEAGIKAQQIQKYYIAGAFGTYLDINSAVNIGMLPDISYDRYHQVGNAAGVGAVLLLLSKQLRSDVELMTERVKYIELSNHPRFTSEFSKALFFENALSNENIPS